VSVDPRAFVGWPAGLPAGGARPRLASALAEAGRRAVAGTNRLRLWVPLCATLIPVLTTGSWLIADARQPVGYSAVRQSVSVLAGHAGRDRWIVTGALVVVGGCYLVVALRLGTEVGLSRAARIGLVVAGIAAIGIAACPEPRHGSTPQHLLFTGIGAVAIAIWPLLQLSGSHPARSGLARPRVVLPVAAGFVTLTVWTFLETRSGARLGLAERLSSSTEICWPPVIVWALYRGRPRIAAPDYRRIAAGSRQRS
jgi:hypothetical protein